MQGKKITSLKDYNLPAFEEKTLYKKDDVKCFEKFFVIDTIYKEKDIDRVKNYFFAFDYDGNTILNRERAYDENHDFGAIEEKLDTQSQK